MPTLDSGIEKRFSAVADSRTFRNICDTFNLKNKTVLDIGCSYGEFLTHFGSDSVGITISTKEALYANTKKLTVIKGNIEDSTFISMIPNKFDVIFANNIFEHLYSPHSFLINIKKLLKKDGLLILGVPCIPKITTLMKLKKFRGSLATQHINFFTHNTLQLTVERAGWVVENTRGFHFKPLLIDRIFDSFYPHLYVIARIDDSFEYSDKRKSELRGYVQP